jgi:TolA-binding protein
MTHSLKYIGITRDALIDAAKYDPPSAELVTALVEALISEADDADQLAREIDNLNGEVDSLNLKIEELETNWETESND